MTSLTTTNETSKKSKGRLFFATYLIPDLVALFAVFVLMAGSAAASPSSTESSRDSVSSSVASVFQTVPWIVGEYSYNVVAASLETYARFISDMGEKTFLLTSDPMSAATSLGNTVIVSSEKTMALYEKSLSSYVQTIRIVPATLIGNVYTLGLVTSSLASAAVHNSSYSGIERVALFTYRSFQDIFHSVSDTLALFLSSTVTPKKVLIKSE